MTTTLQTAVAVAIAAGNLLRRKFTGQRRVTSKGWRDIVTDADFAAQALILRRLRQRFPQHAILAEEGRHEVNLNSATPTWVIDPLDGTTNYARQFPSFSVSIALVAGGIVRLGVVHNPLNRETFFAVKGRGAFLRIGTGPARRLSVSDLSDLTDALVGVDWARQPAVRRRVVAALQRVSTACRTMRAVGSAALSLAYVASGRLDGYYNLSLAAWDMAAGVLLITEAGGRVTTAAGGRLTLGSGQVVASNRRLHARLLRALRVE